MYKLVLLLCSSFVSVEFESEYEFRADSGAKIIASSVDACKAKHFL